MRTLQACLTLTLLSLAAGCADGLAGLGRSAAPDMGEAGAAMAPGPDTPRPVERPGDGAMAGGATAPADPVAAPGSGAERRAGETIATLGNPAQPGLWLETALVSREQPGRVVAASGASVEVTLIPIGGDPGAGSRISLAALQALGLPLTALAPLVVFARG